MTAAEKRRKKFSQYIRKCKKVPDPPGDLMALNQPNGINALLSVVGGSVQCYVRCCTNAEKCFLLKAARKLGFKPKY